MRHFLLLFVGLLLIPFSGSPPASAQSLQDLGIETAPPRIMEPYSAVTLRALDKITARTETFEVPIGETVQSGSVYITAKTCRKAPPIEEPESAAFLQIWEVNPKSEESEWVFSGWMFASSPALSPMDHPVYDVWVLDCAGEIIDPNAPAPVSEPKSDSENSGASEDTPSESETDPDQTQE